MKLSRIYSNTSDVFPPIDFNTGLCIVVAEIRDPANRQKDTHNLGKTTLSRLIDFCLLKGKDKDFFLFKHDVLFGNFVFYLELLLDPGAYITLKRPVDPGTKISFKTHSEPHQDFSTLPEGDWDHVDIAFDKARTMLDGILDLRAIGPWDFRQALGYSLRIQADYQDVFQLEKFKGKHVDWKPYLAAILGFNSALVLENYENAESIEETSRRIETTRGELIGSMEDPDRLEGVLLVKQDEASRLEGQLENYNFQSAESQINDSLVNEIESKIADLNERRYYLSASIRRIQDSINRKISFDPDVAAQIFKEAGISFEGQIKKTFEQLQEFNREIAEERADYLRDELIESAKQIDEINKLLERLNDERSRAMAVLKNTITLEKYKKITSKLVDLKADVETVARQRTAAQSLQTLSQKLTTLRVRREELKGAIEQNVFESNERYRQVRLYFSEIVRETIDRDAVISTKVNQEGNLEFSAEILNEKGFETSQGLGHTYKKLLCIAFDMAVARVYLATQFVHFLYHDGIFETLDDRKKLNLIDIMRNYAGLGLQHIVTMIDSDLPVYPDGTKFQFEEGEIVKVLHDEGDDGRLFRIPSW